MGWRTVARLIDDDLLAGFPPAQAMVLVVLAHMEHGERGAFPSERQLAERSHTSRETVRSALKGARERGLIVVEGRASRGTPIYRFTGTPTVPVTPHLTGTAVVPVTENVWSNLTPSTGLICLAGKEPGIEPGTTTPPTPPPSGGISRPRKSRRRRPVGPTMPTPEQAAAINAAYEQRAALRLAAVSG